MLRPRRASGLVDIFFLGQYVLMSMMAPSFAAGAIAGEKERKTYEMLLASPMRPTAIVLGKLLASLSHLAVLVFASLPIVMLCLPLGGGISIWEVLGHLRGHGGFGRHVRHDQPDRQQLLHPNDRLAAGLLHGDPAAWRCSGLLFYSVFETAAVFRLFVLAVAFPGICLAVSARSC